MLAFWEHSFDFEISHILPLCCLTAEAALQRSLWGVCCSLGQPETTWALTVNCSCHIAEILDFTDTLEQFGSRACCWWMCVVCQPLQGPKAGGRDSPGFSPFWLFNFAYGSLSGTQTTGKSWQLCWRWWAVLASWWRWQTSLSPHALENREPGVETSSLSVPRLSQNVSALVPEAHRTWAALMRRCCCGNEEKKALFRVWPSLSLCHPHCTYTTTSSSSLPHPPPSTIFSLWAVFVWVCIFPGCFSCWNVRITG